MCIDRNHWFEKAVINFVFLSVHFFVQANISALTSLQSNTPSITASIHFFLLELIIVNLNLSDVCEIIYSNPYY